MFLKGLTGQLVPLKYCTLISDQLSTLLPWQPKKKQLTETIIHHLVNSFIEANKSLLATSNSSSTEGLFKILINK